MAQVEFRTGFQEVPDHLAAMMRNMETWKMTYAEAVDKANWKTTAEHLNKVQDGIVRQHLSKR